MAIRRSDATGTRAGGRISHPMPHASLVWLTALAAATLLAESVFGAEIARAVALCGAFQIALAEFETLGGRAEDGPRFVAGLLLGGVCCHLGWVAMHSVDLPTAIRLLSAPAGWSVLFAPIGPWLCAPRSRARRERYLRCALGGLPLSIAAARIGCIAAGCCGGTSHPTQVYEVLGCIGLAIFARRVPPKFAASASVIGLAVIRLAVEPLRAPPAFGTPVVSATAVAMTLLIAGLCGLAATCLCSPSRETLRRERA